MNADDQVKEALELVAQGVRLTGNLMNFIFSSIADKLENNKDKALINNQTKEGKQKINNLLRKHKDGIQSLDDNLTKQQVKEYQKEFKKLGVDFSIIKNEKDNYSFFFAGNQANVIEKGIKNVVELNSKVLENEQVKEAQLDLDSEMNNLTDEEKENVNNAFSEYLDGDKDTSKLENLSEKEKSAFNKMENLNEVKNEVKKEIQSEFEYKKIDKKVEIELPTEKQLELAKKLGVENYKDMNKKEISLALEKAGAEPSYFNNKEVSKELLNERLFKLDDSELKLFTKRIEYDNIATSPSVDKNKSQKLANELKEMQSKHSKETVDKINNIDKDIRELGNYTSIRRSSKLNANEMLKETKKHIAARTRKKEINKTYSMENVKNKDVEIKKESRNKEREKVKQQEQSL